MRILARIGGQHAFAVDVVLKFAMSEEKKRNKLKLQG
jgi:hypothetical protein